ncbi:MAG: SecDF P1 head subdomain-containing protein [Paludibacter sp.]
MKTKIYFLLAVIMFGIITAAFPVKANAAQTILIQSTDINISETALSQSAKIITNRLKDFSNEKFELRIISERNQIQVTFPDNMDLKVAEKLLTQKGEIGFYKMYDRKSLPELLKDSQHLLSLLKNNDKNNLVEIGCCSISESSRVNAYLQSLEQNPGCKFVWSQPSKDSDICLYALRSENGPLLTGVDIESMKSGKDAKNFYIGINFNKPAVALWAEITKQNIGNPIAIVLDNTVLAAPIVRSVIEGGKSMITGDYTLTEVKLFAALGNNGELPLSFKVLK